MTTIVTTGTAQELRCPPFWANLSLDRSRAEPLQRQLYEQIRDGIVLGAVRPGMQVPASRTLASELGCSRNTVLEAVAQLVAEGYLVGVGRSGVYVCHELPDETLAALAPAMTTSDLSRPPHALPGLSQRGEAIAATRLALSADRHGTFMPSMPDVSLFPIATWMQLHAQEWRERGSALLTECDARGFAPLRVALAKYVAASRNVVCDPDQILITAGAQQGIDLVARLLLDPGDCAWVEDPGYPAIRALLQAAGAVVVPVPVDREGITIDCAAPAPRIVAVAPSYQFPTAVTMSLQRRLELLEFCEQSGAWIVEDDYDSEFRYEGRPIAALAGFSDSARERVIYVGTFSKMLFPAVRLGYLVLPKRLALRFARGRRILDLQPSIVPQPALARFIGEGHLAVHVRRMRLVYRQRQQVVLSALAADAPDLLTSEPHGAGMHLVARFTAWLEGRLSDVEAARIVRERGLNVESLSSYFSHPARRPGGFVLGFASADEATLRAAVKEMAAVLRAAASYVPASHDSNAKLYTPRP
jgi:GntR family transcriptional regulator/MocR family aminotransferase